MKCEVENNKSKNTIYIKRIILEYLAVRQVLLFLTYMEDLMKQHMRIGNLF